MEPADRDATFSVNAVFDFGPLLPGNRAIEVLDLLTGVQWTLARSNKSSYGFPRVSLESKRIAVLADGLPVVWTLDLPMTPAATRAWLDQITNAVLRDGAVVFE